MPDLLCLGEPLIEVNHRPGGTALAGFGGDTSNVAIAAARQGADVGYISHIGAEDGAAFLDLWARENVDTSIVRQIAGGKTGRYEISHGPNGHEFTFDRKGSAASLMTPADLPTKALEKARILHVSGISQAISASASDSVLTAMSIVKRAGGRLSYDTNLRPKLWPLERARDVIHHAISLSDIALPGLEDAQLLTGLTDPDAIVDFYTSLGPSVVALTLGAQGTLVQSDDQRALIPAISVEPVDATGAGDTFDGAFLAQLLEGASPFDAARYANVAAGLSTQHYGAIAGIPRRADVVAQLASTSPLP